MRIFNVLWCLLRRKGLGPGQKICWPFNKDLKTVNDDGDFFSQMHIENTLAWYGTAVLVLACKQDEITWHPSPPSKPRKYVRP